MIRTGFIMVKHFWVN